MSSNATAHQMDSWGIAVEGQATERRFRKQRGEIDRNWRRFARFAGCQGKFSGVSVANA